jgi:hypothetical protein
MKGWATWALRILAAAEGIKLKMEKEEGVMEVAAMTAKEVAARVAAVVAAEVAAEVPVLMFNLSVDN